MSNEKINNINMVIANMKNKIIELEKLPRNSKITYAKIQEHLGVKGKYLSNSKIKGQIPFIPILEWCKRINLNSDEIFFKECDVYCTVDDCGAIINKDNAVYNKKDGKDVLMGKCRKCVNSDAVKRYQKKISAKPPKPKRDTTRCANPKCNVIMTKENTKIIPYTLADGTQKKSVIGKCKKCLAGDKRKKTVKPKSKAIKTVTPVKEKEITNTPIPKSGIDQAKQVLEEKRLKLSKRHAQSHDDKLREEFLKNKK